MLSLTHVYTSYGKRITHSRGNATGCRFISSDNQFTYLDATSAGGRRDVPTNPW